MRFQVRDGVGNPVHVQLRMQHHVGEHRGAARTGEVEKVRKPRDTEPKIGDRSVRPSLVEGLTTAPDDVDLGHRPRHRIEPGGQDQSVQLVVRIRGMHTRRVDPLDRRRAQVHEVDMLAVEGLVVVVVRADPLGADRVVVRNQQIRRYRVADHRAHLLLPEHPCRLIGFEGDHLIGERLGEQHTAQLPPLLIRLTKFLFGRLDGQLRVRLVRRAAATGHRQPTPVGVIGLLRAPGAVVERHIPCGHTVVRGALKHV